MIRKYRKNQVYLAMYVHSTVWFLVPTFIVNQSESNEVNEA